MGGLRLVCAVVALASMLLVPARTHAADGMVGTGTPASCTEVAFGAALDAVQSSGGGVISFNCGPQPHVILFTFQKPISAPVELRGGGLITLSGNNATSLFQVFVNGSLTLQSIALTRGLGPVGAVESFGRLFVIDSSISNNMSSDSGGAVASYGELQLSNSRVEGNSAADRGGGILVAAGSASITNSQLSNNVAANGGGGVALDAGTLTVAGSTLSGNRATATFAEGGGIRSAGTLTVTATTFSLNNSSRGGGLFVADGTSTVTGSLFQTNVAAYGGGLRQGGGTLAVSDSTFSGNGYSANGTRVTTGGGALSWENGTATLTNVTISGNWASYGGGFDHANGTTTLTNVTISGNAAVGGGAFDQAGGSIAITNGTITGNQAPFFAAGVTSRGGTFTLKNTLLTNNLNPDNGARTNCNKALGPGGFNRSSDFSCGFGAGADNVAVPLGPLTNNGGPTSTHLLQRDSPALDTGTGVGCPATDQRGVSRPQGQACDIGAVELTADDLRFRLYLPLLSRPTT